MSTKQNTKTGLGIAPDVSDKKYNAFLKKRTREVLTLIDKGDPKFLAAVAARNSYASVPYGAPEFEAVRAKFWKLCQPWDCLLPFTRNLEIVRGAGK